LFEIDAILLTHSHTDHTSGIPGIYKKVHIPVYCTKTTQTQIPRKDFQFKNVGTTHQVCLGECKIECVSVCHGKGVGDKSEKCEGAVAYLMTAGHENDEFGIGVMIDLSKVTEQQISLMKRADWLIIEARHKKNAARTSDHHLSNEAARDGIRD